jgi:TrmH family RNA methyltransferase
MPRITSRQHAIVKAFKAAARGDDATVLLDGWHLLAEAVSAGLDIETIAIVDRARADADASVRLAAERGARVMEVSAAVMDALSPVRSPVGAAALARRPERAPTDLTRPAPALIVAAAGVQDPGNVGAIVRAADAASATGVIVDGLSADPWSWKALRAAMGSTFRVPIVRVPDLADQIAAWTRRGVRAAAADPAAATSLYSADLRSDLVLMMGAEGVGLPAKLAALADLQIAIPMRRPVESLNVAVATALILYEAGRQRLASATGVGSRESGVGSAR